MPHRARTQDAPRSASPPRAGEWLWTTREGAEGDLVDELELLKERSARRLSPGLVVSAPLRPDVELTFARQGFPISVLAEAADPETLAGDLATALAPRLARDERYLLHAWVPDTERHNPLSAFARTLEERLARRLEEASGARRIEASEITAAVPYLQVCVTSEASAIGGMLPSPRAQALAPGGRTRVRAPRGKPSRSARKLEEALHWLGASPGPGDLCVDLGAAPGGWSWVLLDRRARVVAVDPARLRPDLLHRKGMKHVQQSAFQFTPDEPADWLFCDMAWRPLEVAALLGKWARQRWATLLVANFKLPMRKKAQMVQQIRQALTKAGWQSVRIRQLYHDRDEVTVTAHR